MNRFIAFLLLGLYLPAFADASVTVHYCMGKLTGIDIVASADNNNRCSKCSMLKQDRQGCCHDKHETIKRVKDQLTSGANLLPQIAFHYIKAAPSLFLQSSLSRLSLVTSPAHGPPLFTRTSPLLLHCVFRI